MQTTKTYFSVTKNLIRYNPTTSHFRMIEMNGHVPAGYMPVQVRIISARHNAIKVQQGSQHQRWLYVDDILIERGQWAKTMHEGTRIYVTTNVAQRAALETVSNAQQNRERAYIERCGASFEESAQDFGRVQVAQDIAQYMEPDQSSNPGRFDEALSSCSFHTVEQETKRAHDGRRYDIIAIEINSEDKPESRAQIAAYALIEHFADLMEEKAYAEVVREAKHWMRSIEEGKDGLELETREVLVKILVRARHAANAARHSNPYRCTSMEQREQESAALALAKPRRR